MDARSKDFERTLIERIPAPEVARMAREAWRRVRRETRTKWILVGTTAVGWVPVGVILSYRPPFVAAWILATAALAGVMAIAMRAIRGRYLEHLRSIVRERGYVVCQACGYDLEGLAPEIISCPECGESRRS